MRSLLLIFFSFCLQFGFAQTSSKKIVQFSGLILHHDSNTVVPYVTIKNITNNNKVYSANYKGYFSFVSHESDSLLFTAIGFFPELIIIPDNLPEHRFTINLRLRQNIINLPLVRVYPWASIDEFRREFLSLKYADDDLEIARKNISRDNLAMLAANIPRDGREMQSFSFQNNHNNLVNKNINQRFANPLLNPFAWGALMQQIFDGDKSRNKN